MRLQFLISKRYSKKAAFDLHQTTESPYYCVLLTRTLYTPRSQIRPFLRSQADKIDLRLLYVWPFDSHADRARFTRLKDACVKARYSKHYRVSAKDLKWLQARPEELGRAVHASAASTSKKLPPLVKGGSA